MKRLDQLFLHHTLPISNNQTMGATSTRASDDGESVDEDEQEVEGDRLVTYYTVLQVKESARAEEVRKAYLRLALLCHPDRSGDSEALTFRTIKDAYDVLSDSDRRRDYDRKLYQIRNVPIKQIQQVSRPRPPVLLRHQSYYYIPPRPAAVFTPNISVHLPMRPLPMPPARMRPPLRPVFSPSLPPLSTPRPGPPRYGRLIPPVHMY